MYPSMEVDALSGMTYVFPPVVGLTPDPARFPPRYTSSLSFFRALCRLRVLRLQDQNGRGRALDFVDQPKAARKRDLRLDKIGTDNGGGNSLTVQ